MSLLMDALRRAELERRRQRGEPETTAEAGDAGRGDAPHAAAEPPPGAAQDPGRSLTFPYARPVAGDPTPFSDEPATGTRRRETGAGAAAAGAAAEPPDLDLELGGAAASAKPAAGNPSPAGGLALEPLAPEEHQDPEGTREAAAGEGAATTATLGPPGFATLDAGRYDGRARAAERRRPARGTDLTLEDIEGHSVVDAQTVFAAGEKPRPRPLLLGLALLVVLIVVAIGTAGVFYARRSEVPRPVPSPSVAIGVEQAAPRAAPVPGERALPPAPAELAAPAVPAAPSANPLPPETPSLAGSAPAAPAPATLPDPPGAGGGAAEAAAVEPATATAETPSRAAAGAASRTTSVPSSSPSPPPAPAARSRAPAAPPVVRDLGAGELSIARRPPQQRVDRRVAAAYAAFRAGDLAAAESAWRAVLAEEPEHRHAHLGLGALALARGDAERAFDHYTQVLARWPEDLTARAALFALTGGGGTQAAKLRQRLGEGAESAWAHFALGNHYARAGRWGDAQQAYFDALRLDRDNADYAFNLAVSLERLGETAAARDYYRRSLALADDGRAGFDPARALARLRALGAGDEAGTGPP